MVLSVRVLFVILAGRLPRELPLALLHATPERPVWILLRVADVRVREVSSILSRYVAAHPRLWFADGGAFLDDERQKHLSTMWSSAWMRLPDLPTQLHRTIARDAIIDLDNPGAKGCLAMLGIR